MPYTALTTQVVVEESYDKTTVLLCFIQNAKMRFSEFLITFIILLPKLFSVLWLIIKSHGTC